MIQPPQNTLHALRRRGRLIVLLLAALIILGSAVAGICAYLHRPDPPIAVELSNVRRVSILRRGRWDRQRITNVELNDRRSSRIYRDGYELLYALCDASDQQFPLVQRTTLPAGYYRVAASTESGGQEVLLGLLCRSYSEAFDLDIAVREIETYVLVMTCPDRQSLLLQPSAMRHPYIKGDFADGPNNGGPIPMAYRVEFACDMSNLAAYSAYMIRKAWDVERPAIRNQRLATAIVDETGLTGLYEGRFAWDFLDSDSLVHQLEAVGLELTLARRTVKALVVAPRR